MPVRVHRGKASVRKGNILELVSLNSNYQSSAG
uniref:Uncharacterized protein n=1 Tax=Anguilla anguilla TaxID=7936 RepID=A0A0E9PJJ0_ANGAN